MTERTEQLDRLRRRYADRGKEGKSRLLDVFPHFRLEQRQATGMTKGQFV